MINISPLSKLIDINLIKIEIIELSDFYKQIFNSRGYEYKLQETENSDIIKIIIKSTFDNDLCKIDFNQEFNCKTLSDKEDFKQTIEEILNFAYSCQKIKEELNQEQLSLEFAELQNLVLPLYLSNNTILNDDELNQQIINFINNNNFDSLDEENKLFIIDRINNFEELKNEINNDFIEEKFTINTQENITNQDFNLDLENSNSSNLLNPNSDNTEENEEVFENIVDDFNNQEDLIDEIPKPKTPTINPQSNNNKKFTSNSRIITNQNIDR